MLCKMMLYLFGFDIQDILQFLGVAISGFCLFFTYKTFKQAENINRIQEERRREEEVRYKLECIIRELRIQCYKVVVNIETIKKWLRETLPYKDIKKKYEETKNELNELLMSGLDGRFNEMIKDYNLQEYEKKFLRKICNDYVFNNEEFYLECLISDNFSNRDNKLDDKEINTYIHSFFNNFRLAKQICEVYKFDYEMIDKIYSKVVFSKNYDQKTN